MEVFRDTVDSVLADIAENGFFQDLVESGIFYAAFYQGTPDCRFNEAGFDAFPDRASDYLQDDKLRGVVCVYDFGEGGAILYSEVNSQECFLGLL